MLYQYEVAHLSTLFYVKHKKGNASTILRNFQRKTLIKTYSMVHCNLNGGFSN